MSSLPFKPSLLHRGGGYDSCVSRLEFALTCFFLLEEEQARERAGKFWLLRLASFGQGRVIHISHCALSTTILAWLVRVYIGHHRVVVTAAKRLGYAQSGYMVWSGPYFLSCRMRVPMPVLNALFVVFMSILSLIME